MNVKLTCQFCDDEFERDIPAPKFCSQNCRDANRIKHYEELKKDRTGYIYFIQEVNSKSIKIGFTEVDFKDRLAALQTANPNRLVKLKLIEGTMREEFNLHKKFNEYRLVGEWFKCSDKLIEFINSLKSI